MIQPPQGKVTLADVLRLALPVGLPLNGANYATRPVTWVVVLTERGELERQLRGGDLAILPPGLQAEVGEAEMIHNLQTMADLGVVALLVFRPPPAAVSQEARRLGFPLFVLPEGGDLRDVHQNIAALLIDRQTQITERGMQLYRRLSEMSREGQGLDAMVEFIAGVTGKIAVIQDKRLEIVALSRPAQSRIDEAALRDVLMDRDNLPALLRNRKAAAQSRQSYWQQMLPIQNVNVGRLVSPIISGDRARGYLSVIGSPGELDLLDTLTVEHGAAACALEMAKAKAVSEARKALRGNFLEGLLAGTLPEIEIERLAARLDHDTSQPHAVITFAWAGPNPPSMRRLETAVNWLMSSHSRAALVHVYGGNHICVFQALKSSDEDMSTAHDLARRLREHLQAENPEASLVGGLSGPAATLVDWPAAYRQAFQAMQLGQRLHYSHLVDFNSLGVYRLLGQLEDLPAVRRFCEQMIGPLSEYDRRHRSTLVQTIDTYFTHHGNISQTAEALFIHRNTLLYRLERIQELTGQDLNQADMRLALHLALKLWQLRPKSGA
jgi:purine catabolism regulator